MSTATIAILSASPFPRGFSLAHFDSTSLALVAVTLLVFLVPVCIIFPPLPVDRSDALQQTHSRLGLRPDQSNLGGTQMSPARRAEPHRQPHRQPHVQGLCIHPVKSCRGIEVARSRVLSSGLEYDRMFTFARLPSTSTSTPGTAADLLQPNPTWEFLTPRQLPLMANVKVDLWLPDANKTSRLLGNVDEAFLVLRFPWQDAGLLGLVQRIAAKLSRGLRAAPEKEIMLPVALPGPHEIKDRGYFYAPIKVWSDVIVTALNMENELPPELGRYLGVKHRLGIFRIDPTNPSIVRDGESANAPQHPLHLPSLSSMQSLDANLPKDDTMKQLDARMFGANIIVSDSEEYDEDTWKVVKMQNPETKAACHFNVSCRTTRCKLPNADPDTGIRHQLEPDGTLPKMRGVDEGAPNMGCFGMHLHPIFPDATTAAEERHSYVEVGMRLQVTQRGKHVIGK